MHVALRLVTVVEVPDHVVVQFVLVQETVAFEWSEFHVAVVAGKCPNAVPVCVSAHLNVLDVPLTSNVAL